MGLGLRTKGMGLTGELRANVCCTGTGFVSLTSPTCVANAPLYCKVAQATKHRANMPTHCHHKG
eukprot:11149506-Lingulodinium_polyedra.AAC.1